MSNLIRKTSNGRELHLAAGLDIGNGYVKGAITNLMDPNDMTTIDMPSCASVISHPQDLKPETNEVPGVINDIYNQLDIIIGSHMVAETRRLYIGSRGVNSGMRPFEFNVASHLSKANDPLSIILMLSCIAGKAIKDIWKEDKALPTDIVTVHVVLSLALPIREYVKHGVAYRDELMKQPHMVTIHNFDTDVVLRVILDDVAIIAEGVAAQYAIAQQSEQFMQGVLQHARVAMEKVYGPECRSNLLFDVQPDEVLGAMNTVGVDIGEGTVNFPVFRNGAFVPDVSSNLPIGYGSVLSDALAELQDLGYPYKTRKELTEYLSLTPSRMQRAKYDQVKAIVQNHVTNLVESIAVDFSTAMSKAGAVVEVVYIYGGGATPIQEELYRKLMETMRVNQQENVIVLYMDSAWSRYLNREGLLYVAKSRAEVVYKPEDQPIEKTAPVKKA